MSDLPLHVGMRGSPVGDLRRRLADQGLPTHDDRDVYGASTVAAVEAFQRHTGLDVDGVCGRITWQRLVEAGYRLGDRQLYLRAPMSRGDDVADLQRRLGALGFDAGRVDGIFGPNTASALAEFQHNVGLPPDGICGAETVAALERLVQKTTATNVANLREQERLRSRALTLSGSRLAIGEGGGLAPLATSLAHLLRDVGASVLLLDHPDGSVQAREANLFEADVYLGLRALLTSGHRASYFGSGRFESTGGRWLARLAQESLDSVLASGTIQPMQLPVLRETRMSAVLIEIGTPAFVVQNGPNLARRLADAMCNWIRTPVPDPSASTAS